MKKFELFLGGTFVLGRIFALCNVPVYGFLTLMSASVLYLYYLFLSFYLLNGKKWGDIFRKVTYRNAEVYQSVVSILAGIILSSFVYGILNVVMHWTKTLIVVYTPIVFIVFISLVLLFGLKNEKYKQFAKQNLFRILIVVLIGITSVILL